MGQRFLGRMAEGKCVARSCRPPYFHTGSQLRVISPRLQQTLRRILAEASKDGVMSSRSYLERFKIEAVKQMRNHGHAVADVAIAMITRSTHSLSDWIMGTACPKVSYILQRQKAEIRRLYTQVVPLVEKDAGHPSAVPDSFVLVLEHAGALFGCFWSARINYWQVEILRLMGFMLPSTSRTEAVRL